MCGENSGEGSAYAWDEKRMMEKKKSKEEKESKTNEILSRYIAALQIEYEDPTESPGPIDDEGLPLPPPSSTELTSDMDKVEKTTAPFTPPRRIVEAIRIVEEISPTDSNFSAGVGQVWDSPAELSRCEQFGGGYGGVYDPLRNDDVDDHDGAATDASSLSDHITDHLPDPDDEIKAPTTYRITLASCLQCVLARLPCSRTLPTCSRCARNRIPTCLAQRKRFHAEVMGPPGGRVSVDPVLVRVPGEGGEEDRRREEGQRELLRKWREEYERRFWYPTGEKLDWGKKHPGEGMGRLVMWDVEKC